MSAVESISNYLFKCVWKSVAYFCYDESSLSEKLQYLSEYYAPLCWTLHFAFMSVAFMLVLVLSCNQFMSDNVEFLLFFHCFFMYVVLRYDSIVENRFILFNTIYFIAGISCLICNYSKETHKRCHIQVMHKIQFDHWRRCRFDS